MRGAVVDIAFFLVREAALDTLVQTQEDHLRNVLLRVVLLNHVGLGLDVRVPADNGLNVAILDVGELRLVLDEGREVLERQNRGGRVLEGGREEDVVAAKEAQAVEGRACERWRRGSVGCMSRGQEGLRLYRQSSWPPPCQISCSTLNRGLRGLVLEDLVAALYAFSFCFLFLFLFCFLLFSFLGSCTSAWVRRCCCVGV